MFYKKSVLKNFLQYLQENMCVGFCCEYCKINTYFEEHRWMAASNYGNSAKKNFWEKVAILGKKNQLFWKPTTIPSKITTI